MDTQDLNLLRVFEALWRERNVSRAAKQLGVSQPALSHALGRLRRELADPLFVRVPRGIEPTERAVALAQPVADALASLRRVYAPPAVFDPQRAVGRIGVASTEYFEHLVLPRLLPLLRAEAPGIVLQACLAPGRLPKEQMERGEIDLAVAGFFGKLPAGFFSQALLTDEFVCIARRGHPVVKRRLTLKRYTELEHLLISPQGDLVGIIDRELSRMGLSRRVVAGTASFLTLGAVVARSELLLTLPRRLAAQFAEQLPIEVHPLPLKAPRLRIVQAWHERTHADPLQRWFRRLLLGVIRELEALTAPSERAGR